MLTFKSILCPCCRSPVDHPAESDSNAPCEITCEWCGNILLLSISDPSYHTRSEIDRDFEERAYGAITFVLHARGTKVCPQCSRVYPKQLECCPGLIDFALHWYIGPANELGAHSKTRIIEFLSSRQSATRLAIATQAAKWKLDGKPEIPIHSLKEISAEVGTWAADLLIDC